MLDKMKAKDMTILMGDFNAKIGANNTGYEEVIGQTRTRHDEREWRDVCRPLRIQQIDNRR